MGRRRKSDDERKKNVIAVSVTDDVFEEINEKVEKSGIGSISAYLRHLIYEDLEYYREYLFDDNINYFQGSDD